MKLNTKTLADGLRSIAAKLESQDKKPSEQKPNVKLAKLADGTELTIEGDDPTKVGAAVTVVTSEGEQPIPDGTYELETGDTIACLDGKISEYLPKAEKPTEDKEEMASQKALKALSDRYDTLEKRYGELEKSVKTSLSKTTEKQTELADAIMKVVELADAMGEEPATKPTEVKQSIVTQRQDRLEILSATLSEMKKK